MDKLELAILSDVFATVAFLSSLFFRILFFRILFSIVKYANLWGFCCHRGCLSSLLSMPVTVLLTARAKFVFSSTESLFRMFFKINANTFLLRFRAVFKWMSKQFRHPFRLLFLVTGSKISPRCFQPMRSKTKISQLERAIFPALLESYRQLQKILIGLSRGLLLLWLVDEITLAQAFQQSLENALYHQQFQLIL